MLLLILSIFSVFFLGFDCADDQCSIQWKCNGTLMSENNDSYVENFCLHEDGNMTERCCIYNNTVIGLDLRFCEIKRLNISESNFFDLVILDLRENEFDKFISDDLNGLLKLDYLYLPEHIPCPGGKQAWNETSAAHNMTYCYHQEDPCIYLNISCTTNGLCLHTGPALAKCVCKPGHHGYKCLNEGEFPVSIFAPAVIIPTVILSIITWYVQGRDVYKQNTL